MVPTARVERMAWNSYFYKKRPTGGDIRTGRASGKLTELVGLEKPVGQEEKVVLEETVGMEEPVGLEEPVELEKPVELEEPVELEKQEGMEEPVGLVDSVGPCWTVEQVGLVELVGLGEQMGLMDPVTGSGIGTGEANWICRDFGTFVANETGGTRCIGGKIGNGWQS